MTFADLSQDALPVSEPIDRRIARLLWLWASDPERVMKDGWNVQQHIAGLLEPFLCEAFTYHSEGARQGWWSDGVMDVRIEQIGSSGFRTIGLTWWAERNVGAQWIGPFEVEYYFDVEDSLEFTRTIVRFGWKDKNGNMRSSCSLHPRLRKDRRQVKDSDWVLAIELTPPKGS